LGEKRFETKTLEFTILPIGQAWSFRVAIIEDGRGVRKVRVAKGKVRADGSFAQVQKVNFKSRKEAEDVFRAVMKMFDRLEKGGGV